MRRGVSHRVTILGLPRIWRKARRETAGIGEVEIALRCYYCSSDDKMILGVCAGLAHQWNISRPVLRAAMVLWTMYIWWPLLVYIAYWIIFPARPTKRA